MNRSSTGKCLLFIIPLLFFSSIVTVKSARADIFTIGSYNIRNFDYDERSRIKTDKYALKKIIDGIHADLFAVQEIVNAKVFHKFINKHFQHHRVILTKCGGSADQKLGFIYNAQKLELIEFWEDDRLTRRSERIYDDKTEVTCPKGLRPAAIAHFKQKGSTKDFIAIALHLKAGGRQASADVRRKQYRKVGKILRELKPSKGIDKFLILGDFNTTDYLRYNHNYEIFMDFLKENNLYDFSEDLGCTAFWWGGREDGQYYPTVLDHILISKNFLSEFDGHVSQTHAHCQRSECRPTESRELGKSFKKVSDHCPISIKMQSNPLF